MKSAIQILLFLSLLGASAYGYQCDLTYLDLSAYPKYCTANVIRGYCSDSGFQELATNIESGVYDGYYLHMLAVPDDDAYDGPLEITSMEIVSDAAGPASVQASYIISNPLAEPVEDTITFLGALVDTVQVEEERIDSYETTMSFAAGEEKVVRAEYVEGLWGRIFGYNLNVFMDFKPFLTPVAEGTFTLILPRNAKIKQCLPEGYTTDTSGTRTRVTWTKRNFVPWTNPFNDLICTWDYEAVEPVVTPVTVPKDEEPDWLLWSVGGLVVLILLILVFGGGRRR